MMTRQNFTELLIGKDLRSVRQNGIVVQSVKDQQSFDELFALTFQHERLLVMRAVDAVEKITRHHPEFLKPHKQQLLTILKSADHKELKWHIAQLVTRIALTQQELSDVVHILSYWALNKNENKIVRVNTLEGLFDLANQHPSLRADFEQIVKVMEHEMIPSIQARIRRLRRIKPRQM
jgi:hypothetical protein